MKLTIVLLSLILSSSAFATSLTMKEGIVDLTFTNTLKGAKVSINSISILTECLTSYKSLMLKNKAKRDSRITKPTTAINTEILSNDQRTISLSVNEVFTLTSPEKRIFKEKTCTLVISGNIDVKNMESTKTISTTPFNLVYIDTKENITDALAAVNVKSRDLIIGAKIDGKRAGTGEPICSLTIKTSPGKSLNLGGSVEEVCSFI